MYAFFHYLHNKNIVILFVFYLLYNSVTLLNYQGVYWDDWVLVNSDYIALQELFAMTGTPYAAHLHWFMMNIGNGIFSYKIMVFSLYFTTGIFIYDVLLNYLKDNNSILWLTLIYLLIPLDSTKFLMINAFYTTFLFLFFLAFYMLTKYISNRGSFLFRLSILLVFFLSFMMNSLLVFYTIVLFYIFIINYNQLANNNIFYSVKIFILKYLDFIFLPIIFFIYKNIVFMPYGLYNNYNKIDLKFLQLKNFIYSLQLSMYHIFTKGISLVSHHWILFIVIFIAVCCLIYKHIYIKENSYKFNFLLFFIGVLILFLALFPYLSVNKIPSWGWNERHQILMPLGISLIIFSVLSFLRKINFYISGAFFSFLLSIFLIYSIHNSYGWIKDWYYQVSLIENFKVSKVMRNNSTFIVGKFRLDNQLIFNRYFGVDELNGLMIKAFGNDKRLMVYQIKDIKYYENLYKEYKHYGFSSWSYSKPIFLNIKRNIIPSNLSLFMIKLYYYQIFDRVKFNKMVMQLVSVSKSKGDNIR